MSKFEELKQKIKENKYKIILGTITIAGVVYIIVSQNNKIKIQDLKIEQLEENDIKQQHHINVLKSVMSETVLCNLKESAKRQLRYAEGRLNNGLKDGVISKVDQELRREEIEFFSNQIETINEAIEIISKEK